MSALDGIAARLESEIEWQEALEAASKPTLASDIRALLKAAREAEDSREAFEKYGWHVIELGRADLADYEPTWKCPAYNRKGPCDEERCGFDTTYNALVGGTMAVHTENE